MSGSVVARRVGNKVHGGTIASHGGCNSKGRSGEDRGDDNEGSFEEHVEDFALRVKFVGELLSSNEKSRKGLVEGDVEGDAGDECVNVGWDGSCVLA